MKLRIYFIPALHVSSPYIHTNQTFSTICIPSSQNPYRVARGLQLIRPCARGHFARQCAESHCEEVQQEAHPVTHYPCVEPTGLKKRFNVQGRSWELTIWFTVYLMISSPLASHPTRHKLCHQAFSRPGHSWVPAYKISTCSKHIYRKLLTIPTRQVPATETWAVTTAPSSQLIRVAFDTPRISKHTIAAYSNLTN